MNWKSVSYGPFLYSVGDDSSLSPPPSPIPPENDVISQEILIPKGSLSNPLSERLWGYQRKNYIYQKVKINVTHDNW